MSFSVVSIVAGGNDEISVGFEIVGEEGARREKHLISLDAYTELSIARGECDAALYETVVSEAQIYAAYKRGLYILGFGACSERMLCSKLIAKGFGGESAKRAVERISRRGFIDDSASAYRDAQRCAAKLWGESRIRAYLASRKYGSDVVDKALFALEDEGVDFDESCRSIIDKAYKELPNDREAMQRLIASVCRYGYTVSQIKSACAVIAEERKKNYLYR